MIWFSLLSMVIIGALSRPISQLFFQNTIIEKGSLSYFHYVIAVNFLFPLSAALSSFYLGQGQMKKVVMTNLGGHLLHIILDFPLIFGIKGIIPSLGAQGAAISLSMAELFVCGILFWDFLKPQHRELYRTNQWSLNWSSFWKSLQVGLPRAGSKLVLLTAWAAVTHIMIHKQEEYLAVLAFGGTINLFYTCFNEGVSQALTTIGAYLIGAGRPLIWKLARSASLFLLIWAGLLVIPCFFLQDSLIALFFKKELSAALRKELYFSCYWLWVLFMTHGFNLAALGILNAYGDTLFQMIFSICVAWMASFLLTYLIIGLGSAPPNYLWLIMAIACFISAVTYFLRLRKEKWKIRRQVSPTTLETTQ